MKRINLIKKTIWYTCLLLFQGTPLWAAVEEAERVDNIDTLMWIFLAFCALIMVGPLIAASSVLFSKRGKREKAESTAPAPETVDPMIIRYLLMR